MGTPISKLHVLKHDRENSYTIDVPTPNSEFESYVVLATPGTGVCKIVGIGKDHDGDAAGVEIRMAFNSMEAVLRSKYGNSKTFDFLQSGSIWNDVGDFAMALRRNERHLEGFWDRDENSTLPSDIRSINLSASATGSSSTYLTLSYEYTNMDACTAKRRATDNSAL
jgi:hypothetical protein